ncbi:class I SAM-dependent methyltransferase [Winogradskyella sp.]|uniref:class I SAM-dependent methyltransferase n=1 Tax=Winogradskyella sp. TaxID=1883156 RepID=UPI0035C797FA
MKDKLTTPQYWEKYYGDNIATKEQIINVCSYYDSYWMMFFKGKDKGKSLIEIGGFPGRYLSYLSSKFGVVPTCLDYNSDASQIKRTFDVMNVKENTILQEDFTTYMPNNSYDYVLSNGFIEHFDNYNLILDMHTKYLKEEGRLLIMIPNMKGYIKLYKSLVDNENLKIHNLKCMSLEVFRDFAERNKLKTVHLSYFGGFPFNVHQNLNFIQKIIYKIHRLIFKRIINKRLEKRPSKYLSSGIMAIFEKKS